MRPLRALPAAAVAVALAAGPADARTYCHLVREKPGDADHAAARGRDVTRGPTPFGPYDITSMDVATNATEMTVVVRVADLTNDSPTAGHEGGTYAFYFSLDPERHYAFQAEVGGGKDEFAVYQSGHGWVAPEDEEPPDGFVESYPPAVRIGTARGVVDGARDEIRMTAPLSVFGRGVVKPGKRLTHMGGNSFSQRVRLDGDGRLVGEWFTGQFEDAVSARRMDYYPVGAKSCVRVGR